MNNINVYLEKLKKNYINFLIIFFIWTSLFLSLNTTFVPIFFLLDDINITNLLKSRSIFIIISFFLIIFFIFTKKINLKNNLFYFLLFLILAIQSIYFFSDDFNLINNISFKNIYEKNLFADRTYGIQLQAIQLSLSIFISLFVILIFNEKKNELAFTITFLFFIAIFCFFYFSLYLASLPSHLNSNDILLYFNSFFVHDAQILRGEPAVRVTGIGRSLLIISIIFFNMYLFFNKKSQIKFPLLILLIFINTSIIFTGSRFASYSLLLTYCFFILFLNINFLKKIKYFIIFLIFPIILFLITGNILKNAQLNKKLNSNNEIKKDIEKEKQKLNKITKKSEKEKILLRILEKENLIESIEVINETRYFDKINDTTGRVEIWKNAIEISKERGNFLLGNGINADRRLLVKYGNEFGTNASNGLINTYLTSGFLGLIIFIILSLIILRKIYEFIFIYKCFSYFREYYIINLSILIIFIFYQRIFFENSITSFGVDYLLFIVCCYFLLNKIKKLKIN